MFLALSSARISTVLVGGRFGRKSSARATVDCLYEMPERRNEIRNMFGRRNKITELLCCNGVSAKGNPNCAWLVALLDAEKGSAERKHTPSNRSLPSVFSIDRPFWAYTTSYDPSFGTLEDEKESVSSRVSVTF
jgi:hypothetical protein